MELLDKSKESETVLKIKDHVFIHKSIGELRLLKDLKLDMTPSGLHNLIDSCSDITYTKGVLTWKDVFEDG